MTRLSSDVPEDESPRVVEEHRLAVTKTNGDDADVSMSTADMVRLYEEMDADDHQSILNGLTK